MVEAAGARSIEPADVGVVSPAGTTGATVAGGKGVPGLVGV